MVKYLIAVLLTLASSRAFGASTETGRMIWFSTTPVIISTESCPRMEGWEWHRRADNPEPTQEYAWEIPIDTTTKWGSAFHYDHEQDEVFYPWRKVPYKIDWHCVELLHDEDDKKYLHGEWLVNPCIREMGYREDGLVIWRKP